MLELPLTQRFSTLGEGFFSHLAPEGLPDPKLVAYSAEAAALIGLPDSASDDAIQLFSGNDVVEGYAPLAAVYSGHQFGYYVPQLGDGRALTIAETNGYEIQLKGSGKTPYSRFGDGRAVLRSSIREFLCSEAMAALGIPTTRALCVIDSSEPVQRERVETSAMLTRLAQSHIRFGSFEFLYYNQDYDALRTLADFCIEHYYPEAKKAANPYAAMLRAISQRTGELIARWQCIGFAHGVMNTDNMSILGLTLDYGPFGFHDAFDAHYICNHSDENGRYAFDQQPVVGLWNLNALARALSPLIEMDDIKDALSVYEPAFITSYEAIMRRKLGLQTVQEDDALLFGNTLKLLHENKIDYTLFFRLLSDVNSSELPSLFTEKNSVNFRHWQATYTQRLTLETRSDKERLAAMRQVNPKYILRNYLAENAITKAEDGDYSEVQKLHQILRRPFDAQPEHDSYAALPPEWAADISISCSS